MRPTSLCALFTVGLASVLAAFRAAHCIHFRPVALNDRRIGGRAGGRAKGEDAEAEAEKRLALALCQKLSSMRVRLVECARDPPDRGFLLLVSVSSSAR